MVAKLVSASFIHKCLWMLLVSSLSSAIESDINCLRTLKYQLKDPNGNMDGWVFGSTTEGYICRFRGVNCWNDEENMVLNINLGGYGLEGKFPSGVKQCSSLASLNLTGNKLSGNLSPDVFSSLPHLVTLDLSQNRFSGEIPETLSRSVFLNTLLLDRNHFTGHIPPRLALLTRLKQFSVAHNHLKGQIPGFINGNTPLSRFGGNPDLCGFPLDPCQDSFFSTAIITATMAAAVCFPVGVAIGWFRPWCWPRTT